MFELWVAAAMAGEDASWLALPGAFYSQETSLGLAAFGTVTAKAPGAGEGTWPSTVNAVLVGTLEKQASFTLQPTLFLGEENAWAIDGEAFVEHFPTRFYGVGAGSDPDFQTFTRRQVQATANVRRKVGEHVYVGVSDRFAATAVRHVSGPAESADRLLGEGVSGEDGAVAHALGVTVRSDRRDNPSSARRGTFADLGVAASSPLLGATHAYTHVRLDARAYLPFGEDGTVALQGLAESRAGDVPFTSMAVLGGDDVLRGLYEGRYTDHGLAAAQIEARADLFWRLRGVAFAGVGKVFRSPEDLLRAPVWSAGGGLRVEIDEENHSVVRLDVAGGPDGGGFILNFGEAF
jgi:outer membrane protein assembly factor BamA